MPINISMLKVSVFDYKYVNSDPGICGSGRYGNLRGFHDRGDYPLLALPELLRGFANYRMLIYAIVLIVMMLFNWAPAARTWRSRIAEKSGAEKRKRRQLDYGNAGSKFICQFSLAVFVQSTVFISI